jgi:chemotaxis-related protein WspB
MLFLIFQIGADRYALDARQVVEVLPPLAVKRIPLAPSSVAGLIDYHGQAVPLVDIGRMATGRAAQARLSTRIVLVDYPHPRGDGARGGTRLLALLAERVTETLSRDPADFQPSGLVPVDARWLGPVAADARGLVQRVQLGDLLDDELHALLFARAEPV